VGFAGGTGEDSPAVSETSQEFPPRGICCLGGYFFGNIPFVKENFTAVILGIIFVSLLPALTAFLRSKDEVTKVA
jgi:hypothetical protein